VPTNSSRRRGFKPLRFAFFDLAALQKLTAAAESRTSLAA